MILSKDLHVSQLIYRHIHYQLGHARRNHMLYRLRQKYWVINANSVARKILSQCTVCRRYRGKLGEQKMSDLPEERVVPDNAPFTNVGVDYFGPLDVRRGRTVLKRYGVIFTCLSSRASGGGELPRHRLLHQCCAKIRLQKRTRDKYEVR